MAPEPTCFETLAPRTLPEDVLRLPHVDLALVWMDASPFRDFEEIAYAERVGLLVTYELMPGHDTASLDDLLGPDDVLQESWRGAQSVFGTARLSRSTCARWLSPQGRTVVARFETAMAWRDQRGSPREETVSVGTHLPATASSAVGDADDPWRAIPSQGWAPHDTPDVRPDPAVMPPPVASADAGASASTPGLWIVVDDGCPWARSDLRLPNGRSRLLSLWYQQAPGTPIERSQGLPHSWAGRYWDTARLNEWLSRTGHDPSAAYATWGDEHLLQRTSHGAQVLGLLLGRAGALYAPADAQAAELPTGPDLVFVQLPRSVRSTVSRAALTPWVLEGIAHGLQFAGTCRRAVATLSLESYDGPHDGSSLFEAGVQALIEQARARQQLDLRVVLAAGNAHQRQVTAHLDLMPGQPGDLRWEVPPGSERAAWLELWCPADQPLPALQIAAPEHALSPVLTTGQIWAWPTREAAVCAALLPAAARAGGRLIWVRMAPTQVFQDGEPTAPCGTWRLVLTATVPMRVHAYLARVWAGSGGRPRGRQGRLSVGDVCRDDLQRQATAPMPGSVSGMACGGPAVTVVGGALLHEVIESETSGNAHAAVTSAQPAAYSGRGPARGGWRAQAPAVDALQPSEESRCLPGLRSTGHLDGSAPRMGGTSMAVPLYARTLAHDPQPQTPPP